MMKNIELAGGVSLPADSAATQVYAFLGRRGSGKSYGAGVLVEGLLTYGAQVIVLDPIGIWYGLRLAADGKARSRYQIPVFGGKRGDVPLTSTSGALVAKVLIERGSSAVLDVSQMRKGARKQFVTDFLEELYALQKDSDAPRVMHVVLEEARVFCPQKPQKGEERMLGAVEDVVRLGRNHGIGATLIDQRPQSVNKDALSQTEVLVALQMTGVHEREAIAEWIKENAGVEQKTTAGIVAALPELNVGEAFVWSPQWLKRSLRTNISRKVTFDASSTPTTGGQKVSAPPLLSTTDLHALVDAMREVEKEVADADPKKLRARIAELESLVKHVKTAGGDAVARVDRLEKERVDTSELEADHTKLRHENAQLRADLARAQGNLERVRIAVAGCVDVASATVVGLKQIPFADMQKAAPPATTSEQWRDKDPRVTPPREPLFVKAPLDKAFDKKGMMLKRGAREMLSALAASRTTLSRDQIATLAGLSPRSGTFSDYVSSLKASGYITTTSGGPIAITELGKVAAGAVNVARSPDEVLALWEPKLKAGARRMLRVVIGRGNVTREQLGHEAGISPRSGTFSDYLSKLRSCALIWEEGHNIKPATSLVGASVRA